jgi:hypothetical protein
MKLLKTVGLTAYHLPLLFLYLFSFPQLLLSQSASLTDLGTPNIFESNATSGHPKSYFKDPIYDSSQSLEIFIPSGIKTLRGIYFDNYPYPSLTPSANDFGWRNSVSQGHLLAARQIAALWGFAYLHGPLLEVDGGISSEINLIEAALKEFAAQTGHMELPNLPMIVEGGSRTGNWCQEASPIIGHKLIACMTSVADYKNLPTAYDIPITVLPGEEDSAGEKVSSTRAPRSKGALITTALLRGEGHICGYCRDFAWPFFDEMIKLRMPSDWNPLNAAAKLTKLPTRIGWVGLINTWRKIRRVEQFKKPLTNTAWLPTKSLAFLWRATVLTDPKVTIEAPVTQRRWAHGLGEEPLYFKANEPLELRASSSIPLKRPLVFFAGSTLLGKATKSDEGYVLKNVRLPRGIHPLIARHGRKAWSRAAVIVVE